MSPNPKLEEIDATAEDSEASTVTMGDDNSNASSYFDATNIDTNHDSFIISDIDDSDIVNSNSHKDDESKSPIEVQKNPKVNVLDIFNKFKPSKIRKEAEDLVVTEEKLVNSVEESIVDAPPAKKSGITAKDILTGKPAPKQSKKEEKDDIVHVPSDDETEPTVVKEIVKSGITARDILTGSKKSNTASSVPQDVETIEVISSDEESTTQAAKKSKKKKSKKPKSTKETMVIKLKYKPRRDRIADLESKIRNSMASSVSAKDLFKKFDKKQEMVVNLSIAPEKLKEFEKVDNSFFTKGSSTVPGAKSYLDMLSYKPVTVKNSISKLKELPTPTPTKDQLHVTYDSDPIQHREVSLEMKSERITEDIDYSSFVNPPTTHKLSEIDHSLKIIQDYDLVSIAETFVPTIESDYRYSRFLHMLSNPNELENTTNDLWTNFFKPKTSKEVLFDVRKTKAMRQWLKNSFKILKKKTKRPNFRKLRKGDVDEFDDFITDELDDDTEDEEYVPIMILCGPEGVGKSSAVYTLVEELSGYVYEINASQARGRKDIMTTLKELSTTQLVHQNQDTKDNEFQKGVILFEDVDILFESDRGFWSVMEHVLSISRRPIILTCKDISVIPSHILECALNEKTLHDIRKQPLEVISEYLFLMALTKNIEIDREILEQIIKDNSNDLRKCICALQVYCEIDNPHNDLIKISHKPLPSPTSILEETDFNKLIGEIDAYSVSDLYERASKSLVNHELIENEVLSNEAFVNEEELRTSPLPFELNIGKEIKNLLPQYPYDDSTLSIGKIKDLDKSYLKSKLKFVKRITRNSAMSMFDFDENMDSKNIFALPSSTYTTDVSPFFRVFSREELRTDIYNSKVLRETEKSAEELFREGLLIKKKFKAQSDMLLQGPFRYWNV